MKIKTLLITAALASVSVFTVNAEEVTATWALGSKVLSDIQTGTVSNADFLKDAILTVGSNIKVTDGNLKATNKVTSTNGEFTFTNFGFNAAPTDDGNSAITFSVTACQDLTLKSISLLIGGDKTVYTIPFTYSVNDIENALESIKIAKRENDNTTKDFSQKFDVNKVISSDSKVTFTVCPKDGKESGINIANVVLTFASESETPVDPEKPEIPEGAVVAPFNYGSFYDVTKAECTVANFKVTDSDQYIENTKKGTIVNFPFYVTEESDLFFYIETGAKDNSVAWLKIYLDNEYLGEHEVKNTTDFAKYDASTVLKMPTLQTGKHVLRIERDEERSTLNYAGNWHIGFYSKDVYDHASISPEYAKFTNCKSADNIEVGWIKDGSSIEYKVFVPEAGSYALNIGITNHNTGICTASIAEEDISVPFSTSIESRSDIRQIALGDINTPGIKTLRLEFTADHQDYIANYDNLGLERTGDVSGIADVEAAEVVAVEYYNLQGVRVEAGARGTLIRVSTDANGSRKAEKVIVR